MIVKCSFQKCEKELTHTEGKKKKKYCNANCKLKDWQQKSPLKKQPKFKMVLLSEWEEIKNRLKQLDKENCSQLNSVSNKFIKKENQPTSNSSKINIKRMDGESMMDYKIRIAENS